MSKAAWARLAIGCFGVVLTGFAIGLVDGTGQIVGCLLGGFILTSAAAEFAFRRVATQEEVRKDLEDRNRD